MSHHTQVVEVLQSADGIVSVCISCCGLHGEWKPCPGCGAKEEKGCAACDRTALEPHPLGGMIPVKRPGFVKDPDTRSWNVFHLVVHEPDGTTRLRSTDELQAFLEMNHKRIADQHEAAQQAIAHAESMKGNKVQHGG